MRHPFLIQELVTMKETMALTLEHLSGPKFCSIVRAAQVFCLLVQYVGKIHTLGTDREPRPFGRSES